MGNNPERLFVKKVQFHGPLFPHEAIARITLSEKIPWRQRSDHLWLSTDDRPAPRGYLGKITCDSKQVVRSFFRLRPPTICISTDSCPQDGDIVRLLPKTPAIEVLFESNSPHNALFLTPHCNCRCIMCPQELSSGSGTLTEINRRIIRLMAPPPRQLAITGGEPTLVPKDLLAILTDIKNFLPQTDVQILTNARALKNRSLTREIAKIQNNRLLLGIPLYSDIDNIHDEIMGSKGAFHDTLEGLYNAALYRFPIELRVVVLKANAARLPDLADFIFRAIPFVIHVAFMGLEMRSAAELNMTKVWIEPQEFADPLLHACKKIVRYGFPCSIFNLPLCVLPKELWGLARQSISLWKRVFLPQCQGCTVKNHCGGVFGTGCKNPSSIAPIPDGFLS
ncbi:MAG: His-Xaa-Ser system radical SAM maturase HxsC [Verrucomicrobiae bacterium]|nr:His-Xaa-Ser system radical SAM maturase HxsC [Verrucomicrobiae bacterium]